MRVGTHQNFITTSQAVKDSALVAATYQHTPLSTLIVHLFHLNFGTNLRSLAVCLVPPPPLAVVGNNLGVYKKTSIIRTTVLGVILKLPLFCVAGFNLSCGLQTPPLSQHLTNCPFPLALQSACVHAPEIS